MACSFIYSVRGRVGASCKRRSVLVYCNNRLDWHVASVAGGRREPGCITLRNRTTGCISGTSCLFGTRVYLLCAKTLDSNKWLPYLTCIGSMYYVKIRVNTEKSLYLIWPNLEVAQFSSVKEIVNKDSFIFLILISGYFNYLTNLHI